MSTRRVRRILGLTPWEAELLIDRARSRLGRRGYGVRLVGFSVATAPGVRRAIPAALRHRAIRPMVYALIPGPSENLLYASPTGGEEREHG